MRVCLMNMRKYDELHRGVVWEFLMALWLYMKRYEVIANRNFAICDLRLRIQDQGVANRY